MADQTDMQGFFNRWIYMFLRRLGTMAPALILLGVASIPAALY
jgi:hypothetical protein